MSDVLDAPLALAFAALRSESGVAPRPEAMHAARAAMHRARATSDHSGAVGGLTLGGRLRRVVTAHRLTAGAGAGVAGLVVVAALGWNAPASSPLHAIQLAHEQISLDLPGSDRVSLDLGFAESRLGEARTDGSGSALDEARGLLNDARGNLAAGSPLWSRWQDDEQRLGELRDGEEGSPSTPGGAPDGSGGGSTAPSEPERTTTESGGATAPDTSTRSTTGSESRSDTSGGDG